MKKVLIYKIVRIVGGVILGLILLVCGAMYLLSSNLCDEELVGTYKSPDNTHEVVYKATRCGAISEDVGHLILDDKEVVNARLGDLKVVWKDNTTLHVEYSGIRVIKLIKEYNGVNIDFMDIPTKISDKWSVNVGTYEGKPMILRIRDFSKDMLPNLAKVFPYQVGVAIPFHNPDANGFPSADESEQLLTIEDILVPLFEKADESIYVASITTGGMREFVFYVSNPDTVIGKFETLKAEAKSHKPQLTTQKDADWGIYRALGSSMKQ